MSARTIHYEAAFEDFVRSRGWPYVAVDQAKKALFADAAIKSFDFLVYSPSGPNLLVDVKGRKFPDSTPGASRRGGHTRAWENWITRDDVNGLREWQKVFGEEFLAVLVFAYWLQGPPQRCPFSEVHCFRGRHYAFVAMGLEEYVESARPRSAKWQTLAVPAGTFSQNVRDLAVLL